MKEKVPKTNAPPSQPARMGEQIVLMPGIPGSFSSHVQSITAIHPDTGAEGHYWYLPPQEGKPTFHCHLVSPPDFSLFTDAFLLLEHVLMFPSSVNFFLCPPSNNCLISIFFLYLLHLGLISTFFLYLLWKAGL